MKKALLNRVLGVVIISYCAFVIINISAHKDLYQWDLYRYYACAKAYQAGINPYDAAAVSEMVKRPVITFTNPPIVLFISQIFTKIDFNFIFYLYLILKCLLLTGLIYLWRNTFLNKEVDIIFYLLCLLGFNATIYLDLRAGNITILEQCMLWLAFFYYLKGKFLPFCIFIITAAIFKIQPILFLFLLLLAKDTRRYKFLVGSLVVFAAIILMQYIFDPWLFSNFITGFNNFSGLERGIINPSISAFLRDLVDIFLKIQDPVSRNIVSTLLYFIVIIPIILMSRLAYIRIKSARIEDKDKWVIFFSCSTYSLIANYFKDYSYILLILPAYFLIKNTRISPKGLLLFIAIISAQGPLPGEGSVFNLFWNYYPLFVAYFLWCLYVYEMRRLE